MKNQEKKGEIIIYKEQDSPEIQVNLVNENVWLTQAQIAELFGSERSVITKHLGNIFKSAELSQDSVCAIFAHTAADGKIYKTRYYNLDAVISVGYRVNSRRATQFRIWATKHLRDFLLKGYLINEKRLRENQNAKLRDLQQAHKMIQEALEGRKLEGYEKELLNIIADYANTWEILDEYDSGKLKIADVIKNKTSFLNYDRVRDSVERFRTRLANSRSATEEFGLEQGRRLAQILKQVQFGLDGLDVYPSAQEKAAQIFYAIIKERPFRDGNKRIGSLIFILFLIENRLLYNRKGEKRINDSALAALAVLVSESKASQKDVMVKLIVNLINKK